MKCKTVRFAENLMGLVLCSLWGISKWLNSEGLSIHKGLVARRQKGLSEEVAESICVDGQIYL